MGTEAAAPRINAWKVRATRNPPSQAVRAPVRISPGSRPGDAGTHTAADAAGVPHGAAMRSMAFRRADVRSPEKAIERTALCGRSGIVGTRNVPEDRHACSASKKKLVAQDRAEVARLRPLGDPAAAIRPRVDRTQKFREKFLTASDRFSPATSSRGRLCASGPCGPPWASRGPGPGAI